MFLVTVTTAYAKRTGAAASVERRRCEPPFPRQGGFAQAHWQQPSHTYSASVLLVQEYAPLVCAASLYQFLCMLRGSMLVIFEVLVAIIITRALRNEGVLGTLSQLACEHT